MGTYVIDKNTVKERRLKRQFFNNIWKTFYLISVYFEKSGNERYANVFFEICSNILEKEDYYFSQKTIEDTLSVFSREIEHECCQRLKNHLLQLKEITGTY